MIILGINCVFHESSAALIIDGRVVAAAEEERFNRVKHAKRASVDTADVLPVQSIAYCLDSVGLTPGQIDRIACSFDLDLRRTTFEVDPLSTSGDWGSAEGEALFLQSLARVPEAMSTLLNTDLTDRFRWVPHHLAHAASAFYPAGDGHAAVMVVDGIGESATALFGGGHGTTMAKTGELRYPDSIGFVWEKLSDFLGFSPYDASKVMGLASYGDGGRFAEAMADLTGADGKVAVRSEEFKFRLPDFHDLEARFGARRLRDAPIEQRHMDVAAALQDWNNRVILTLAEHAYDLHPASTLCYSGGVALNCTTNWLLKEKGPFSDVYIPSAPHDGGTAIGAALWTYFEAGDQEHPDPAEPDTPYTGPEFRDEEILAAFAAAGLRPERSADVAEEVAGRVAAGAVVGWFQGRMELGPRALGNRSLVADPRDPGMRDVLNRKVKHREDFRPFAPSVLAERAAEWFEMGRWSESYRFMLFTCPVRPERAERIPAVVHTDGTSRVQTVSVRDNPRYHRMISCFEAITGVPMVLNTSFNDSEPIVCSPSDALATFAGTRIDAVAVGDYIASR
ncbi:carbamoyltransferase [Catenulispora sp. GAS73]|uniref:carbamoyltransferase family protein n=1 Tax=Catenulispora sp. GAS73 TaxID=3156269 RepID=UPI00351600D0